MLAGLLTESLSPNLDNKVATAAMAATGGGSVTYGRPAPRWAGNSKARAGVRARDRPLGGMTQSVVVQGELPREGEHPGGAEPSGAL